MAAPSWTIVDPSLPALTCAYSFGPGWANALALVLDGGVIVVSPPVNVPESAFTELEQYGPVRALVASNAYHHLGLPSWKARHPDAAIFAPTQSIARVEKQAKLTGIRPVAEMAKLLGERAEILDMPHYKTGEVLVRWRAEGGWAWYVTDVIMNLREVPPGLFGMLFKWTKTVPGLRRNAISPLFMVKDKRALYAWITEQAQQTPPSLVVACHGQPARLTDPAAEIRALFG